MYIDAVVDPDTQKISFALPVRVTNKIITVWVTENYARYYTREETPDFIKQRLAMINTCNNKHLANDNLSLVYPEHESMLKTLYFTSRFECPEGFEGIGWRVNNKYYYIIATESERLSMRGVKA